MFCEAFSLRRFEMLESEFKREFMHRVKARLRNVDLDFIHNTTDRSKPDMIILGPMFWAALEFKQRKNAKKRPNQSYHVERMNAKGYARFVYPENSERILEELVRLFDLMDPMYPVEM
jgi:hypothetical protein